MMSIKRLNQFVAFVALTAVLAACQTAPAPEPTFELPTLAAVAVVEENETPAATATSSLPPTNTPAPTQTPAPTAEPQPTATREPKPTVFVLNSQETPATQVTPSETTTDTAAAATETAAPATGEVDGLDILAAAAAALNDVESFEVVQNASAEGEGAGFAIDQTCRVRRPGDIYCTSAVTLAPPTGGDPVQIESEFVKLGETLWIRDPLTDEWRTESLAAANTSGFSMDSVAQFTAGDYVNLVENVQETTLDGTAVYQIDFAFDADDFLNSTLNPGTNNAFSGSSLAASGSTWIGVADSLPRRTLFDITVSAEGQTVEMTIQTDYANFNQPVEIPNPGQNG